MTSARRASPTSTTPSSSGPSLSSPGPTRSGSAGVRRRGRRIRRTLRSARHHLHRPVRRRRCGCWVTRLQAKLRPRGERAVRAVVERPGQGHGRGTRACRQDRLPDDPEGQKRRWWPRHPDRAGIRPTAGGRSNAPRARRCAASATRSIFMEHLVEGAGTSRCRSSPTTTATSGRPACGTARSSARTRSSSRNRRRRCSPSSRRGLRQAAIALVRRSATAVPAPSSSCTSRRSRPSPSSRSTPGCRSSTRSPRPPPGSTWSSCRSWWPRGSRWRATCPPKFGHAVEARLNAEDADAGFAPAPGGRAAHPAERPRHPGGHRHRRPATSIPPDYDSMVAKIIAWGRDRYEALARLVCALRETTVVLARRHHHQVVPAGAARSAEVIDAHRRHRLAGPGRAAADPPACPRTPTSRCSRSASTSTRRGRSTAIVPALRPRRASARPHVVGRTVELGYLGQSYKPEGRPDQPAPYRVSGG